MIRTPTRTSAFRPGRRASACLLLGAFGSIATVSPDETMTSPTPEVETATGPLLDRPTLPPAPIIAACGLLLDAEAIRIALPAGEATLQEALRLAALESEVSIEGDWAALDAIGLRPDDRLQLPTTPATIPVLLEQVVSRLTNAWDRPRLEATKDGLLLTTTTGAERLSGTLAHPIGDLLHGEPLPTVIPGDPPPRHAESIRTLVETLIEPDSWFDAGGSLGGGQHDHLSCRPTSTLFEWMPRMLEESRRRAASDRSPPCGRWRRWQANVPCFRRVSRPSSMAPSHRQTLGVRRFRSSSQSPPPGTRCDRGSAAGCSFDSRAMRSGASAR